MDYSDRFVTIINPRGRTYLVDLVEEESTYVFTVPLGVCRAEALFIMKNAIAEIMGLCVNPEYVFGVYQALAADMEDMYLR